MGVQREGVWSKRLEPRNWVLFFAIASGWSWFWWPLFILGVLGAPILSSKVREYVPKF